jgi:hypothetical protein
MHSSRLIGEILTLEKLISKDVLNEDESSEDLFLLFLMS